MSESDNLNRLIKALTTPPQPIRPAPVAPRPIVRLVTRPKVFVSFDYENDGHYKRLLEAWSANTKFQFTFQDKTPQEIQTDDVSRVKAVLTTKVQEATYVLVLVGKYANQRHADAARIGCSNWIHFECQQAITYKKKLVAVLLEPTNQLPTNILTVQGQLVRGFNQANILAALSKA